MEWIKEDKTYRVAIKSWCRDLEKNALSQAEDLAMHPEINRHVALMPDCHPGFGMPIGGVIACEKAIIPNAVGVDIGCGMGAVKTNIRLAETNRAILRQLTTTIKEQIPCGEGRSHKGKQSWDNLTPLAHFEERPWYSSHVRDLAEKKLGTLGGGNHFIEVQADTEGNIWLMIHSGSRHLGNVIAKHHHNEALKECAKKKVQLPAKDLAHLAINGKAGQLYIADMNFALAYARENRRHIMARFMETFAALFPKAEFETPINIHHNYAALETHFGRNYWIHRKGATSAKPGEIGIIPGSMGAPSFIVIGLGNPDAFMSCSHGAGRVMGRMQASRTLTPAECDAAMGDVVYDRWHKMRRGKSKGLLDLGEAPQAYKNIHEVIEAQKDLIEPLVELKPLAVVKG